MCGCSLAHDFIEQQSVMADYSDLPWPWPMSEWFREDDTVGVGMPESSASSSQSPSVFPGLAEGCKGAPS